MFGSVGRLQVGIDMNDLMGNYETRIKEIEEEILQLDYERLKCLEKAQRVQAELNQALTDINRVTLTRKGEIIGLKRLIETEKQDVNCSP
jgi:hypothetical protein